MKNIITINAIIWAVLILVTSYILGDHEKFKYVFGIMLFLFSIQHGIIENYLRKKKCKIM